MTPDLVAELLRQLMKEALILAAPLLLATALLSFVLSLFQTLTSLQEQSLTSGAAPGSHRHDSAGGDALVSGADGVVYIRLLMDFHRYLG
jgi:flagellar biosynthetic protein FliQ